MSERVLVHRYRHQGPMWGALDRYGIGHPDENGRGIWITEEDLPEINLRMKGDPTRIEAGGRLFVQGTNKHNHVEAGDFKRLFGRGVTRCK